MKPVGAFSGKASDLELSRFHHFLFLRIETRLRAADSPIRAVFNN
jgi:hypothetical protein